MAKKKAEVTRRMCLEHGMGIESTMGYIFNAEASFNAGDKRHAVEWLGAAISVFNNMKDFFPSSKNTVTKASKETRSLVNDLRNLRSMEMPLTEKHKWIDRLHEVRNEAINLYSEAKQACQNGSPLGKSKKESK